jgi:hypothetical protein
MAAHGPVLRSWNVQTRAHGTGDFHFGSPLGRRRSAQQAEWQQSALTHRLQIDQQWRPQPGSLLRHDRCHDGIECRDQVRQMQSNLQSSLTAVDIDEVVLERMLFDYRRSLARLTERPKVR